MKGKIEVNSSEKPYCVTVYLHYYSTYVPVTIEVCLVCYGRENLQLCVGPLLHTVLINMEEKAKGKSPEPNR